MKLNTSLVLANENQRHSKPKLLPVIKTVGLKSTPPETIHSETISPAPETKNINSEIVIGLKAELASLQRQRGKLGTQTTYLVADLEKKLRKENDSLAEEFLKGNLPMPELADHATKINNLTLQASIVWDQIRHAEQYGTLPPKAETEVNVSSNQSEAAKVITYEIRRLDDMIYKTSKKIKESITSLGNKKNSCDWLMKWKNKLAMAETQREQLKTKLKRIQGDVRER